ncbi:MAG TPA: M42 family metallopeptidase [Anaerolineae bacterium]|nr:M42 family metallopeptidase [Anaerolineae bacterium]
MAYVQEAFAKIDVSLVQSPKGLMAGDVAGQQDNAPRALTAHTDTLGAMVRSIKSNGRLQLTQLGGWLWNSVEGEGVTIFASNGKTYRGAIMPTTASIHAHPRAEQTKTRDDSNMEVRIDARTSNAQETLDLGIRVGDIIAFDPRVEVTDTGFIRSRHLDDKAGVATIYGALSALHKAGLQPKQRTTIHISNYEEVGHGAATGFPPDIVELLTIDMAVVAPNQTSDEFSATICAKDSRGPYHLGLRRRLEQLATEHDIQTQTDIYPFYGSDGEAFWGAGANVAVALIGPGVAASHHYERTHRDALLHTANLINAYLLSD